MRTTLLATIATGATGLALLGATATVSAASAPMGVSVTVVRSCAVGTQATPGTLTLACSKGVSRVNLGNSTTSDVRLLAPGSNALTPSSGGSAPRESATPSQPLVVTVNF